MHSSAFCAGATAWMDVRFSTLKSRFSPPQDPQQRERLFAAVRSGSAAEVQAVLREKEMDGDARDVDGNTALMLAADGNFDDVIRVLIEEGNFDSEACGPLQRTALHRAVIANAAEAVAMLIRFRCDVNAMDENRATALHMASEGSCPDLVLQLLAAHCRSDPRDHRGRSPLHLACAVGCEASVRALIRGGADVNGTDERAQRPLHYAAEAGWANLVEILVANGADPDARDDHSHSPLHICASLNKVLHLKVDCPLCPKIMDEALCKPSVPKLAENGDTNRPEA